MNNNKPRIAVTMGDPAGVGPEVCLQLLANPGVEEFCIPLVYGDASVLRRVAGQLGWDFNTPVVARTEVLTADSLGNIDRATVLDFELLTGHEFEPGRIDARCGEAAYQYISAAIDDGLRGDVSAITTGPINKEALQAAGHFYPGHTEIFAERMQADLWCMMLTSDVLTCSFVTAHVGYAEVPNLLTTARILEVIELTATAMRRIRGHEPKLLACGLNPHAGEHGLFGQREEEEVIAPAVEAARTAGINIEGPLPPDTVFLPWRRETTDAVICMYHDQGHIPLKALAFDVAVNTTLGLPVVRTSVDHGTAFDIAWQGKASASSLFEAVRLAAKLCRA